MFSILSAAAAATIAAAQKLGRTWIGIDVTPLSVDLMKLRPKDSFGMVPAGTRITHHRDTESTEKTHQKPSVISVPLW